MQTETTDWLDDILITPANTERAATNDTEAAACSGHCSQGFCRTAA